VGFVAASIRLWFSLVRVSIPERVWWVLSQPSRNFHASTFEFQSLKGFGGFCRLEADLEDSIGLGVSIPERVWWVLSPPLGALPSILQSLFQSLKGFGGFCRHSHGSDRMLPQRVSIPERVWWVLSRRANETFGVCSFQGSDARIGLVLAFWVLNWARC
jgi:hypothetical protein